MRGRREVLVLAVTALGQAACSRDSNGSVAATAAASATATASASATASAAASATASASVDGPVRRELALAPITSASIVGWNRPGVLRVTLAPRGSAETLSATVSLALDQNPIAHRRPLAFERLARELGMRVVPATVLRRIGAGELGALFASSPDLRGWFGAHAAVQNDGTVDALVTAPARGEEASAWLAPKGHDVTLEGSFEVKTWARWTASAAPVPGENAALARDYVETLVLDYLAGNVLRRVVFLDDTSGAIHLTANDSAFPSKVDPRAQDLLLVRLRPVARFPRGLRDALVRLDRARARALLAPGPFEGWLVSPRTLIDLDERRASVLTLIEARIAEHGEAAVLSL